MENPQGKLVSAGTGAVFDVAADVNPDSDSFGQWVGVDLNEENHRQLWIPPGYAHGFCVLSDEADFQYKCTALYDPDLAIDRWFMFPPIMCLMAPNRVHMTRVIRFLHWGGMARVSRRVKMLFGRLPETFYFSYKLGVFRAWKQFCKTMLRLAAEREKLGVVADQFGKPTSAGELARIILAILPKMEGKWGTYHVAQADVTSWYGFASVIFDEASAQGVALKISTLKAIATTDYPTPAKRPANSGLDCHKIEQTFNMRIKPWRESLAEVIKERNNSTSEPRMKRIHTNEVKGGEVLMNRNGRLVKGDQSQMNGVYQRLYIRVHSCPFVVEGFCL